MSFWFYLAVFGVLWLVVGLAVAWCVGGAFRLGGNVPVREQPDLWADHLQDETFNDWPPRVDDDRRAA